MIISFINLCHTRQVEFVITYTQARIKHNLHMNQTKDIYINSKCKDTRFEINQEYVCKNQAVLLWNKNLTDNLLTIDLKQSAIDEYIFFRGRTILAYYVGNGIFDGPCKEEIYKAIQYLNNSRLDIKYKGYLPYYLGINADRHMDVQINLSQPQIIQNIINQVNLSPNATTRQTSELVTNILQHNITPPQFYNNFYYHGEIGWTNFLKKTTCINIAYITHQCVWLSEDAKDIYGAAAENFVNYLAATKNDGLILDPDKTKHL